MINMLSEADQTLLAIVAAQTFRAATMQIGDAR
jgi:hypothetical protein